MTLSRSAARSVRVLAMPLVLVLGASACATGAQSGAASSSTGTTTSTLNADLYQAAVTEAKSIAGGKKLGGSIEYLGPNGGAEGQLLTNVYQAFTEATGTKIRYTGSQDYTNLVQSRSQAGNPPDIADLPLGVAADYARKGKLMDLTALMGSDLKANYNASLLDGASVNGKVFGVYQGFSNFMVWYNPQQYSGPKSPTSWQQMADWTKQQAAKGKAAWCIAENAGAGSGFPGAQFIEALFAKKYGPDLEKQWGTGQLKWTSPQVKDAWTMFGRIATNDKAVAGGVTGSLSTAIATGSNGLISSPPQCQADLWGSWVPGLIGSGVQPGTNLDFFRIPASNPNYAKTEIFQTTVASAFKDTPATRAFLRFVASTPAQKLLASEDHWTVANKNVPADTYKSALLQRAAKTFFGSDVTLATGPNVLASSAVTAAFYKGVVAYLQKPSSLDSVLASIQSAAQAS